MTRIDWDCPLDTWQNALALCPDATFFHTPAWYQAHAATTQVNLKPVHFQFDDGATAVLPLAIARKYRGLVPVALSGLENGYGGLVSAQPLRSAQMEEAYRLVRRRYPDLVVTGNPFARGEQVPTSAAQGVEMTQAVPLLPRAEQLRGFAEMRGRHVRQAMKGPVQIEVVHGPRPAEIKRFFPLYAQQAEARKYARGVRDEAYFEALLTYAGPHLTLFLAHHEGQVIGVQLVATYPPVAIQLHLAVDGAYNRLNAGSLLVAEALGWCYDNGLATFDFMASGQQDGVRLFKASFGAEPRAYVVGRHTGRLDQSLQTLRALTRKAAPRFHPAT
jgi:GNAT superfamily N-acetyltransferase